MTNGTTLTSFPTSPTLKAPKGTSRLFKTYHDYSLHQNEVLWYRNGKIVMVLN